MGIFGKPIHVVWSPGNPDHSIHKERNAFGGKLFSKAIQHEYILLYVAAPKFEADKTSLRFSVSNRHEKALGFGAAGIWLRTDNEERTSVSLATSTPVALSQKSWDPPMKNTNGGTVMVDEGRCADFEAEFGVMQESDRIGVAIEAKRIFARHFIFSIVFEFDLEKGQSKVKN
jgi:hypothetical protein